MTTLSHAHDVRTGRPLDGSREAVETLTDWELEREMTIAALTSQRSYRFESLLVERRRRRQLRTA